jgi:hypothetical protein
MKKQKYFQGAWTPKQIAKYDGDYTKIFYRSSWELKFMNWCDNNSTVLSWSSEETIVPYRSPVDSRLHRYFVDFKIKVNSNAGVKTYLVEIKPDGQTRPPKVPKRNSKRYLIECSTFLVNQAKWEAANRWAIDRGWEFIVLTEKHLF